MFISARAYAYSEACRSRAECSLEVFESGAEDLEGQRAVNVCSV